MGIVLEEPVLHGHLGQLRERIWPNADVSQPKRQAERDENRGKCPADLFHKRCLAGIGYPKHISQLLQARPRRSGVKTQNVGEHYCVRRAIIYVEASTDRMSKRDCHPCSRMIRTLTAQDR